MWLPIFANLAVTAIMLIAWNSVGDRVAALKPLTQRVLFGVTMATSALGSMMMTYELAPGVFFDLRGSIIAISAFFGGVPAALIAGGAAIAYRIYLGGSIGAGFMGIFLAMAAGLAGYAWRRARDVTYVDLLLLGLSIGAVNVCVTLLIAMQGHAAILHNLTTSAPLSFAATTLLGAVLLQETRRRELAASNRLYRSMVDALPDCLNIKDTGGRFLAANPATARLMRAPTASDLIGKTDFDFYPESLARSFRADELAVLAAGSHTTMEQPAQLPDGSSGWLSTQKTPIVDENGEVVALVTHNRDITTQKQLQARLAETQGYLDQALSHMNDGLAMYDRNGILLFSNGRYRQLFPKTAHLRTPGNAFADVIRAAVDLGEEPLPEGVTIEEHLERKLAALRQDGERAIELADGRTFTSRTKVLPNGCTLRMTYDVTERRSFEKDLERQALHDPLTGLPNRTYFNRELDRMLEAARANDSELVVMLLDLDRFKEVNDTFGHAVGDQLLVNVARRLETAVRRGDLAARLGGDEFAILMSAPAKGIADVSLATRVMKALTQPLKLDEITLLPSGTIGYTVYPRDRSAADTLLKNADKALYRAKARGRGTWKAYEPEAPQPLPVRA